MSAKYLMNRLPLSGERELRTVIENRKAYTMDHCELNIFETYRRSELVPLRFDDLVITSMLRGKKVMHLSGKPEFDYLPGETVIVPPSVKMEIDFPVASQQEPTQCTALAIGRKQVLDTLDYLNSRHPKQFSGQRWQLAFDHCHLYNSRELATLTDKLIRISVGGDINKDILVDLTLKELLIRIMQLQHQAFLSADNAPSDTDGRMRELTAYIRNNITEKLSVGMLSKAMHMSIPSFFRAFRNEMGISPMEYVIRERINYAKQLLAGKGSVKEACFASGFNNTNYFVRMFKKHEGITPGAYRIVVSGQGG